MVKYIIKVRDSGQYYRNAGDGTTPYRSEAHKFTKESLPYKHSDKDICIILVEGNMKVKFDTKPVGDGGTWVTNFSMDKEPIYIEALEEYGKASLKIGPSSHPGVGSLHYFGGLPGFSLSDFWAIYDRIHLRVTKADKTYTNGDIIRRKGYTDGFLINNPDTGKWSIITSGGVEACGASSFGSVQGHRAKATISGEEMEKISLADGHTVVGNIFADFNKIVAKLES